MKKILLLEDDKNLNRGVSLLLQKEGYEVLSAICIKEAEVFLNQKIDLIISDITLPDGNGMDFCRKIREKSNVYLIFLTVLDQEIDMVNGYDSGADDYITKPFHLLALASKVNALMKRLDEKEEHNLVSGALTVKLGNMQVIKNNQEIVLSKKEFCILKLLMENAGQIVTREKILENVWDLDGNFVDENTVAVNISRLKKKLRTNALENVRGVGYLWKETVIKK